MKEYSVVNKETGISVQYFDKLAEALKKAENMTNYHHEKFIVKVNRK